MENITVTFSSEQEQEQINQPIFTRYLYIVPDVYASLIYAIENKKRDEALFWAYELYYSGFENELVRFLEKYIQNHPLKIKRFIESKINILRHNKKDPSGLLSNPLIATIVVNITTIQPTNKNIFINYCDEDIEEFQTVETNRNMPHWKVLRTACLYPSKKDYIYDAHPLLKHHHTREEYTKFFREDWEYYAYFTTVWKQRIEKYGGEQDHESRKIVWTLEEEEEEDITELFYEKFGYEPDEQPIELFHKLISE